MSRLGKDAALMGWLIKLKGRKMYAEGNLTHLLNISYVEVPINICPYEYVRQNPPTRNPTRSNIVIRMF